MPCTVNDTRMRKQTHRCWFPSGTGPRGVGYHLGPQSPLQGKHQWLSLIPHSRSVLKGPRMDGEMGETLHISGHGRQPQVPSHHTRAIPLNMEHKDKGAGIGSERGEGANGGERHSIPLKSRADEETYTNTHTADKQVHSTRCPFQLAKLFSLNAFDKKLKSFLNQTSNDVMTQQFVLDQPP